MKLVLGFGGLAALLVAACGGGSDTAEGTLAFHGEVDPLGDFHYDSGLVPAGSPVQTQLLFVSKATLAADAAAIATKAGLASVPGSGTLTLAAKFLLRGRLKVDVGGLQYDGDIPGLDAIDVSFAGTQAFEPFALTTPVMLVTSIPETKLPDLPLPGGLPGVLSLTITSASTLTTSFSGTCAASDGKTASYRGNATTKGAVAIQPTVVLHVPIVGDKSFDLPVVQAAVPGLDTPIDLGTLDVAETSDAPAGADTSTRTSCDTAAPPPGGGDGGASSSSGGTLDPDGGTTDAGAVLACADATITADALVQSASKSAIAQPGSCTGTQLDAFDVAVNAADPANVDALYASVDGACRACIFTELDDDSIPATAAALYYVPGQGYAINDGWCIGNRTGEPSCGQAYAGYSACGRYVCASCGTADPSTGDPDATQQACIDASYADPAYPCAGSMAAATRSICGDSIDAAQDFCAQLTVAQTIRLLCGPQ